MCVVAFDLETIYKNAFFTHDDKQPIIKLIRRDIVVFCDILETELSKIKKENNEPVYAVFLFQKKELELFYELYTGVFVEIGEDIYHCKDILLSEVLDVNSYYDDSIKKALNKTRLLFKKYLISK